MLLLLGDCLCGFEVTLSDYMLYEAPRPSRPVCKAFCRLCRSLVTLLEQVCWGPGWGKGSGPAAASVHSTRLAHVAKRKREDASSPKVSRCLRALSLVGRQQLIISLQVEPKTATTPPPTSSLCTSTLHYRSPIQRHEPVLLLCTVETVS